MSLLQHLRMYHGDWMPKREELNDIFASRPSLPFTVYPTAEIVTGRPVITNTIIAETHITLPNTTEPILLTEFYLQKYRYRIQNVEEFAVFFDSEPHKIYPAELIFIYDIETYSMYLPNRFTIVV